MSDTVFSGSPPAPLTSAWFNDVNNVVYRILGNSTGPGGPAPTSAAQIVANLGITPCQGGSGGGSGGGGGE